MNTSKEIQQELIAFLSDTYRVEDAEIVSGGKHPKIKFTYNGKRFTSAVPGTSSDVRAFENQKSQLRRVLGAPPDPEAPRAPRTLAAMTAALKPLTFKEPTPMANPTTTTAGNPVIANGGLALHISNKILRFYVPNVIRDKFYSAWSGPRGCRVDFTAPDLWTIRHGENDKCQIKAVGLEVSGSSALKRFGPFGATPAEYKLVGGRIEVKLLEEPRAVKPRRKRGMDKAATLTKDRIAQQIVDKLYRPEPESGPVPPPAPSRHGVTEADMRAALEAIRRIEAQTPYRLVKRTRTDDSATSWAFVAPRVE